MNDISKVRFDALAAYCRQPQTIYFSEEVRWLELYNESILVVLILDRADEDFGAIILAKDLKERYRCVGISDFFNSQEDALNNAKLKAEKIISVLAEARVQGDEKGKPIDFFTHVKKTNKLNNNFLTISTEVGFSPAVGIIKPMMRWHEDLDGNFIEQFQTTGFDARIWELYIFAMLVEAGYIIDNSQAVPDFNAKGILGHLFIEATTVNPTIDKFGNIVPIPNLDSEEEFSAYLREYVPIKFSGPLTAKLSKKYWENPNVKGKPLVLAIQDFHSSMSMTMTKTGLSIYLYGYDYGWEKNSNGKLNITPKKVINHQWGNKIIDSGFFSFPGAENISAVIVNPSATISKFNRMGLMAGFGSKDVKLIRKGLATDFDPNASEPKSFEIEVNSETYSETWIEGMDVYHNPNAVHPLDPLMLPGAAHHRLLKSGEMVSQLPEWHPLSSLTFITISK